MRLITSRLSALAIAAAALGAFCAPAVADGHLEAEKKRGEIYRAPIPGSDFPISTAVQVPPRAEILYVSGVVPGVADEDADPNSRAAYGDTKAQTISVLNRMKERMEGLGWSLGDIVMMRVYLVADEDAGGRLDFRGFMEGYSQFFGTEDQPNKPARAVMQVAELIRPGWRVEIEAQAARMPKGKHGKMKMKKKAEETEE